MQNVNEGSGGEQERRLVDVGLGATQTMDCDITSESVTMMLVSSLKVVEIVGETEFLLTEMELNIRPP